MVGDSGMEDGTKKYEKQYRIFEPHLPIVPVKVKFSSTVLFWRFKKQYKTDNLVKL